MQRKPRRQEAQAKIPCIQVSIGPLSKRDSEFNPDNFSTMNRSSEEDDGRNKGNCISLGELSEHLRRIRALCLVIFASLVRARANSEHWVFKQDVSASVSESGAPRRTADSVAVTEKPPKWFKEDHIFRPPSPCCTAYILSNPPCVRTTYDTNLNFKFTCSLA